MKLYNTKETEYFTKPRKELIFLLPKKNNLKILEIGAGGGDTLVEIKTKGLAEFVAGVELCELANSNQNNSLIDKFLISNIESMDIGLQQDFFDVILIGDVLEHLIDPWSVLKYLNSFLNPTGLFIVSIPNIRHFRALLKIYIKGSFSYTENGLFDKTHLRFFCKNDMIKLFQDSGFEIINVFPMNSLAMQSIKKRIINKITFNLFEEFFNLQYVFIVSKFIK